MYFFRPRSQVQINDLSKEGSNLIMNPLKVLTNHVCLFPLESGFKFYRLPLWPWLLCFLLRSLRNPLVEAIFEKKNPAFLFVRLVSAVGQLVAPLLHPDTLAVVAGELTLLLAPSQLRLKGDLVTRAARIEDSPVVLPKRKGLLTGV